MTHKWISPQWPAHGRVKAVCTTRSGGQSLPPFNELNLGAHVGDEANKVAANRSLVSQALNFKHEAAWLNQTHTNRCVRLEQTCDRNADAIVTSLPERPLVILTADCLPIFIASKKGDEIAAIHAGWRGLAHGILEQTLQCLQTHNSELLAWVGPAICGQCYEVGEDVFEAFTERYPKSHFAFKAICEKKWLINTSAIAEQIFTSYGLQTVIQSQRCTFEEENHFYSYRRDGQTGRIASFIWIEDEK